MCQHLHRRIGAVLVVWPAELGADVVGSRDGLVASQDDVAEIATLLGDVLRQSRGIKAGAWDLEVEHPLAGRDCDRYRGNDALFGSCVAEETQRKGGYQHV